MSVDEAAKGGQDPGAVRRFRRAGPAIRWALAALVLLGLALLWRVAPVSDWVDREIVPRVDRAGVWGYVGFAAVYAASVVLMAPGSVLTLASGYLFGPVAGAALAATSATLGASLAFLVARRLAREAVRRCFEGDRRFRAVDRAVARQGGRVVLLLRLAPIVPFNLLNYAMGLTGVRFRSYVSASFAGLLPGSAAFAFIGASAGGRRPEDLGWGWWALLVALTLLVVAGLSMVASRALSRAGADADAPPGDGPGVGTRDDASPPTSSSPENSTEPESSLICPESSPMPQATDVRRLSPENLRHLLDEGEPIVVLDVREEDEREYCSISLPESANDLHVPIGHVPELVDELRRVSSGRPMVVYCHHGIRSLATARWLAERGLADVANLEGGIDAWSLTIDPEVPRY